jgi:hypothetical protein
MQALIFAFGDEGSRHIIETQKSKEGVIDSLLKKYGLPKT